MATPITTDAETPTVQATFNEGDSVLVWIKENNRYKKISTEIKSVLEDNTVLLKEWTHGDVSSCVIMNVQKQSNVSISVACKVPTSQTNE